MRKILATLLIISSLNVYPQSAPPTLKGQAQTSKLLPKPNLQVPNNQATNLGGLDALIETGSTNEFQNSSFEHSSVSTGWTIANATASPSSVHLSGNQSLSLSLTGALSLSQLSIINASKQSGVQKTCSVYVDSADVSDLQLCSMVNGSEDKCTANGGYTQGSGKRKLTVSFVGGATSNGCKLKSTDTTGTVLVDDFTMGDGAPIVEVFPSTDITTFTPGTPSGLTLGNGTLSAKYARLGDSIEVEGTIELGTTSSISGALNVNSFIPSGLAIDTGKLAASALSPRNAAFFFDNGPATVYTGVVRVDGTNIYIVVNNTQLVNATQPVVAGNLDKINFTFKVPIVGWSGKSSAAYVSTSSDYDWIAYTPTSPNSSFGTISSTECFHKRQGSDLLVNCKFTSGTSTASEARISLPSGLTSADTSKIPSIRKIGAMTLSSGAGGNSHILIEPSVSYFTFGYEIGTTGGLVKSAGNNLANSGSQLSFEARLPIQGWSNPGVIVGSFEGIEKCASAYECTDTFSAQVVTTSGSVLYENLDFISSCTAANPTVCTFVLGVFTSAPNCTATPIQGNAIVRIEAVSSSSVSLRTTVSTSGADLANQPFTLSCQKAGDYTPKTAKVATSIGVPTVPGIVGSGVGERIDTFTISYGQSTVANLCSSSPCFVDQIGNAVMSVTRSAAGTYSINTAKTYAKLKCIGNVVGANVQMFDPMTCANCSAMPVVSRVTGGGATDSWGTLHCQGSY